MIDNSIESLFKEIDSSKEYQEYQKITKMLSDNKDIMNLIEEIKSLEKEATKLEHENNPKYKEIDKLINKKVSLLKKDSLYQEYLERLRNFNNVLKTSSSIIEEYITDKISI